MHAYVICRSRPLQCIWTDDDTDMHVGELHSHSMDMISAAGL